jgi:serine/threonine-protein kinase ATR
MPLNEECGLLEWVSNTNALKSILEKGYGRHQKKLYVSHTAYQADVQSSELAVILEDSRARGPGAQIAAFKEKILPM